MHSYKSKYTLKQWMSNTKINDQKSCNENASAWSMIFEGLVVSVSSSKIVSLLQKHNIKTETDLLAKDLRDTFVSVKLPLTDEQAQNLKNILSISGWFVTQISTRSHKVYTSSKTDPDYWFNSQFYKNVKNPYDELYISPKYDEEVDNSKLPNKLYHAAPSRLRNKILTSGLMPKSNNRLEHHPERLYFTANLADVEYLIDHFKSADNNEYDIWYISDNTIQSRRWFYDTKFLNDPDSTNNIKASGIYTVEPIDRYKIKLITN